MSNQTWNYHGLLFILPIRLKLWKSLGHVFQQQTRQRLLTEWQAFLIKQTNITAQNQQLSLKSSSNERTVPVRGQKSLYQWCPLIGDSIVLETLDKYGSLQLIKWSRPSWAFDHDRFFSALFRKISLVHSLEHPFTYLHDCNIPLGKKVDFIKTLTKQLFQESKMQRLILYVVFWALSKRCQNVPAHTQHC